MLSAENLEAIESEGVRILQFARAAPDAPVPQYPGWTLADLVSHTASIHGRTTLVCRTLPEDPISAPRLPRGVDPLGWYEDKLFEMIEALRSSDPTAKVWSFTEDATLAFWERRMVIETGVHRWDAQQALEEPEPLLDSVAIAGLDEFSSMWLPRLGAVPTLELTSSDLQTSWVMGRGQAVHSVSGTASDLYLRLMSRPGIDLPEDWAAAVDGLAPPPKR